MKTPTRRELLRVGCCTIGSLGLASSLGRLGMMTAMAQSAPDYRALVCIFLFGGNDGNNLVVPLGAQGYADYTKLRAGLTLPSASLLPVGTSSSAVYGLHPQLAGLSQLYAQKKMALVANVGMLVKPVTRLQYQQRTAPVPSNLFSHSDQTSQWQSATPIGAPGSGWAGRVADLMQSYNSPSTFPLGVSVSGASLFLSGQSTLPSTIIPGSNMALDSTDGSAVGAAREAALQQLLTMDSGAALVQAASATTAEGIAVGKLISNALTTGTPLTTVFPATGLGTQLQQVARVIQVRNQLGMKRQIFFCSMGGFDTHSNQLNDQNNLFAQLSPALTAFYNATAELGVANEVTAFTESEFGRTCQPSSGAGSDHAWGSHHMVVGGAVKGGDLYGTFPSLVADGPDDAGSRGSWIPTTGLDQYGATLASWFGVGAGDLATVFPNLVNFSTKTLGFVG